MGKKQKIKKVNWQHVQGWKDYGICLGATALGAGLLPWAPGTWGSLVGLGLAYVVKGWSTGFQAGLWILLTLLGIVVATLWDDRMQTRDHQTIVIDEVVGVGVSTWTAGEHMINWWIAFVFFRIFDTLKPPPVQWIDRWSHQPSGLWSGWGVMADDLVAGFQTLFLVLCLQYLGILF